MCTKCVHRGTRVQYSSTFRVHALNFPRTDRRRVPGTLWPVCTREIVIEAADHQHHSDILSSGTPRSSYDGARARNLRGSSVRKVELDPESS